MYGYARRQVLLSAVIRIHVLLPLLIAAGAVACDGSRAPVASRSSLPSSSSAPTPRPAERRVTLADVGLDAASLDRTADPCVDFYQFACGGWLATHEIPADRPRWGRNIEVAERHQVALRGILEQAAAQPSPDPAVQAIGTFYGACMDEAGLEAAGTRGIEPLLAQVRAIRDVPSLTRAVAALHRHGVLAIFTIGSEQDAKDASSVIARLDHSDVGALDHHHYVDEDAPATKIRAQYRDHVARMLQLAGRKPAEATAAAGDVLAIETALARAWKTPVERRDPSSMYNKLDRAGLARLTPTWSWDAYFRDLGFPGLQEVNVTTPALLQTLERLLASTKPAAWRSFLEWQVLSSIASALPQRFHEEAFSMRRLLSGTQRLPDRWKRCVAATEEALDEALNRQFVERHFTSESRDVVRQYVAAIGDAFEQRLGKLDWMDDKTKARARDKHKQMTALVGYPSTWRVYDFPLDKQVHAANVLAARAFDIRRRLAKVGKPVDREGWQMTASQVNAYYDPQLNQMALPAGILQPPFYSPRSTLAVNMGSTGETIGHELTHGFDDEGSQFDAKGDLATWWEPETRKRFEAKTQCVAEQYSAYEALGIKINGKLTLGENLADLGGLELAFQAYRALRAADAERVVADGFDEDQQFFLSYAQTACTKWREERERSLLKTGIHAPRRYRVNGPVTNMSEFARAFSCAEGKPLSPVQRCEVW